MEFVRRFLPHVSRLFLTAYFLHHGVFSTRGFFIELNFYMQKWNAVFAFLYVVLNSFGLLFATGGILLRYRLGWCCSVLYLFSVIQMMIGFSEVRREWLTDFLLFFFRQSSLIGATFFIHAESIVESIYVLPGSKPEQKKNAKAYLQLGGRILLVLMFFTTMKFEMDFLQVALNILGLCLVSCIVIGFKTKMAAVFLTFWTLFWNFYFNSWWNYDPRISEVYRYYFLVTLSTIGGLIMVVQLGPGRVSLDEKKKDI